MTSPARRRSPEAWSWVFMRLSGLALLFLALVHFSVTHIVNDVAQTDYAFVARRWQNRLWRAFDWALLTLALAHGVNGMRGILADYVRNPRWRRAWAVVMFSVTGALFALGTLTVVQFPR